MISKSAAPGTLPAGRPGPLGVERVEEEDAFNFALYSRYATGVTLLCYAGKDSARPMFVFRLQHPAHKTGSIWHCRIPESELRGATLYAEPRRE
jgi:glycogen operon protein